MKPFKTSPLQNLHQNFSNFYKRSAEILSRNARLFFACGKTQIFWENWMVNESLRRAMRFLSTRGMTQLGRIQTWSRWENLLLMAKLRISLAVRHTSASVHAHALKLKTLSSNPEEESSGCENKILRSSLVEFLNFFTARWVWNEFFLGINS